MNDTGQTEISSSILYHVSQTDVDEHATSQGVDPRMKLFQFT